MAQYRKKPEEMTAQYRNKPVVIDAVRVTAADYNGNDWDGSPFSETPEWLVSALVEKKLVPVTPNHTDYAEWAVKTLEGTMLATPGDMIIRDIGDELYPCKPGILVAIYEEVT